jgi:hypothetical protein
MMDKLSLTLGKRTHSNSECNSQKKKKKKKTVLLNTISTSKN